MSMRQQQTKNNQIFQNYPPLMVVLLILKHFLMLALMHYLNSLGTSSVQPTNMCNACCSFAHGWEGLEGVRDIILVGQNNIMRA